MNLLSTIITSLKNDNPEFIKKIIDSIPKTELIKKIKEEINGGKSETIELLLNLNIPFDAYTENNSLDEFLHIANNKLKILLLQNGANVNTRDGRQRTITMILCDNGHNDSLVEILKFNPDLNLTDIDNKNAFHYASHHHGCGFANILYQHLNKCNSNNLNKIKNLEELNEKQQTENLDLKKEILNLKNIIMTKHNDTPHPPPPTQEQWELINKSDNEHENINNVLKPIEPEQKFSYENYCPCGQKTIEPEQKTIKPEQKTIKPEQKTIEPEQKTIESEQKTIESEQKTIINIPETFLQKKQKAEEKYKKNQELKENGFYDIYLVDILTIISNVNSYNGGKSILEIKDKIYCSIPNDVGMYVAKLQESGKIDKNIFFDKNIIFSVYMANNITYVEFGKATF